MRTTFLPASRLSMVAALSLAVPSLASATTFTVGDGSGGTLSSLREAIQQANAEGFSNLPHTIIIDSALYDRFTSGDASPAGSCVTSYALPTLYAPATIQSTGGAAATIVPPLSGRDELIIDGVTVEGGAVWVPSPFGNGYSSCNEGAVQMRAGTLQIVNSSIVPGDAFADTAGIQVYDSDVTIADSSVAGFAGGVRVEREFHASEHMLTIDTTTFTGGESAGVAVDVDGYDGGSFTDLTISGYGDGAMYLGGGAWVMTGGSISDNDLGVAVFDGAIDIDGTTFANNFNQAIYAAGFEFAPTGVHVAIRNASFTGHSGEEGGAIYYDNATTNGALEIEDSTFTENFAYLGGSIYARGRIRLDGIIATGSADYDASAGGFLYLIGEGSITDSTFDTFDAEFGGVISHAGLQEFDSDIGGAADFYLDISNSSFDFTSAAWGAALHIYGGATTVLTDVTSVDSYADQGGGFAYLNEPAQRLSIPIDVRAQTGLVGFGGAGGLRMSGVEVTEAFATYGGAVGAGGMFNEVWADGLTLGNVEAGGLLGRGLIGLNDLAGVGGAFWMYDASTITLNNMTVTGATAESYGGLIYSGPVFSDDLIFSELGGDITASDCREPLAEVVAPRTQRYGNTWRLGGLDVSGVSAGFDGGIGFFSLRDDVAIHGAEFVDVRTGADLRRGLLSGLTSAHIVTENVTSYDMTCVSVCDAASGSSDPTLVGGTVRHYDAPMYVDEFQRRPTFTHQNNIYSYNEADSAVVALDVCAPEEMDTGFGPILARVVAEGFDSGPRPDDTDVFDTAGDSGAIDPRPRGYIDLSFNTFIGSPDATLIGGYAEDIPVRISHNQFTEGGVAIALTSTDYLFGGYNQFADMAFPGDGDAAIFPTSTEVEGVPVYTNNVAECSEQQLWLADGSPGQDAGDPDILDWWNDSIADVGAYGGPNACFPDEDKDGFIVVLDCNDLDLEIRPGANETPYDGIDQDCDGDDWCDVDNDGFLSDADACGGDDCDDARADVNPSIEEIWYDGIDQDCSGDDCDQDGDGYAADNEQCGGVDCDDTDASIHPGAVEIDGDGIDSDCDDEDNIPPGCDEDGDGVLADSEECGGIDCNDNDATIYPGAPEVEGDGIDSNCDDDDNPVGGDDRCDDDGDGVVSVECGGIDCDDTDASIYPGADDVPYDGIDQDCDGADNCDADGDGFDGTEGACMGDDCDDTDPSINPGEYDIPGDGIDQDCDDADGEFWVQGGPGGCDCSTTGGSAPVGLMWLGLVGLVALRRRR